MNIDKQSLQPIINFIWSVADDVLINKYLENQYQDVILPMTVLRRLDLALEDSKSQVLDTYNNFKGKIDNLQGLLTSKEHGSGLAFYNTSPYTMKKLLDDPKNKLYSQCGLTTSTEKLGNSSIGFIKIVKPFIDSFTMIF